MPYKRANKELGSKNKENNQAVTAQHKINASVPSPSAEQHLRHMNITASGKNTLLDCIFNLTLH